MLASCKGECTKKNGGFNEANLAIGAERLNEMEFDYEPEQSSNSAVYTLCRFGGGGAKCDSPPNTRGRVAAGWGNDLFEPKEIPEPTAPLGFNFDDETSSHMAAAIGR